MSLREGREEERKSKGDGSRGKGEKEKEEPIFVARKPGGEDGAQWHPGWEMSLLPKSGETMEIQA